VARDPAFDATISVGDDPSKIEVRASLASEEATVLRFGANTPPIFFFAEARVSMLVALRDKINAHLNEISPLKEAGS